MLVTLCGHSVCSPTIQTLWGAAAFQLGFSLTGSRIRISASARSLVPQLRQLGEDYTGPLFDRVPRRFQHFMSASRHCSDFGGSCLGFRHGRFCQSADAIDDLSGIETAFAGKALPVLSAEMVAPAFTGDLLSQIFGYVAPHFTTHNIVDRRERCAAAADHDRVVFGVGVRIATQDVHDDHIEQPDNISWGQMPPGYFKHVLQTWPANS